MSITATSIEIKWQEASTNRIMAAETASHFLVVSFKDFRLPKPANDKNSPKGSKNPTADYISMVLKEGILINGKIYHFFGHSNSQLKEKTCVLYADTKEKIWNRVNGLGDFSKLAGVGKRAKRLGLLFSGCQIAMTVGRDDFEVIEDVVNDKGENFTDGCG